MRNKVGGRRHPGRQFATRGQLIRAGIIDTNQAIGLPPEAWTQTRRGRFVPLWDIAQVQRHMASLTWDGLAAEARAAIPYQTAQAITAWLDTHQAREMTAQRGRFPRPWRSMTTAEIARKLHTIISSQKDKEDAAAAALHRRGTAEDKDTESLLAQVFGDTLIPRGS